MNYDYENDYPELFVCPICRGGYDGNGDCPQYHDNDDVHFWYFMIALFNLLGKAAR